MRLCANISVAIAVQQYPLTYSCQSRLPSHTFTAIWREVVGKNVHATIPKGNMGYDQYTVPGTVAVKTSFVAFVANIRPWPLVPFFQISVKNSELKTTHNTFSDCRVYFFRQPFSK